MTFGSLFSGVGGMDLGLERAGMTCNWQVEIDPFARRVLVKHWPNVRRHDDVKTFPPTDPEDWRVDLICGGFPCQDVSLAGKRAGLDGDRSGLWFEFERVIRDLRPRFVLVENTPGLISSGLGRVLGGLASLGFDAEWSLLSACSMGAPHTRERLFIVAYPAGVMGEEGLRIWQCQAKGQVSEGDNITTRVLRMESTHRDSGMPHGISRRLDRRYVGVGNAVVPAVAEWIGRRIIGHAAGVTS